MMKRYSVSGIYIFDKFPDEEERQPTCIEDCQEETRLKWLNSLDAEALKRTFAIIIEAIKRINDVAFEGIEDKPDIDTILSDSIKAVASSEDTIKLVQVVNLVCQQLHEITDYLISDGIIKRVEDDEVCGDSSDLQ